MTLSLTLAIAWMVLSPPGNEATSQLAKRTVALPGSIATLARSLRGEGPNDVRAILGRALGPPTRDIGAGVSIPQWDLEGGTLTFDEMDGVTFLIKGHTLRLIETHNFLAENLVSSYEMTTLPIHGMSYWMGDLNLRPDGSYRFTVSGTNGEQKTKVASSFFIRHPNGRYQFQISRGLDKSTLLENINDETDVCTIFFVPADSRIRQEYRIRSESQARQLVFTSKEKLGFHLSKGWKNAWK